MYSPIPAARGPGDIEPAAGHFHRDGALGDAMFDPRLPGILGASATLPAWDSHTQGRSQTFA
jgi:hypothetical protein